jgi:hypothetical protein
MQPNDQLHRNVVRPIQRVLCPSSDTFVEEKQVELITHLGLGTWDLRSKI